MADDETHTAECHRFLESSVIDVDMSVGYRRTLGLIFFVLMAFEFDRSAIQAANNGTMKQISDSRRSRMSQVKLCPEEVL